MSSAFELDFNIGVMERMFTSAVSAGTIVKAIDGTYVLEPSIQRAAIPLTTTVRTPNRPMGWCWVEDAGSGAVLLDEYGGEWKVNESMSESRHPVFSYIEWDGHMEPDVSAHITREGNLWMMDFWTGGNDSWRLWAEHPEDEDDNLRPGGTVWIDARKGKPSEWSFKLAPDFGNVIETIQGTS